MPGGTFNRSNDPDYPATVSDFRLDKYEVTVGRFRKFVAATLAGWKPPKGSGKHTHLNGGKGLTNYNGDYEYGLLTVEWNIPTQSDWTNLLIEWCQDPTWTPDPGANENRALNCLEYYFAYVFCIWDGGFLPSQAEWNYAAAGGSDDGGRVLRPAGARALSPSIAR